MSNSDTDEYDAHNGGAAAAAGDDADDDLHFSLCLEENSVVKVSRTKNID